MSTSNIPPSVPPQDFNQPGPQPQDSNQQGSYAPSASQRFFTQLRSQRLRRCNDGWIAGVATALSRQYGWDVSLVRGILILLGIVLTPVALFAYALAWALVPAEGSEVIEAEEFFQARFSFTHLFIGVITLISLSSSSTNFSFGVFDLMNVLSTPFWFLSGVESLAVPLFVVAAAVVLVFWVIRNQKQTPPAPPAAAFNQQPQYAEPLFNPQYAPRVTGSNPVPPPPADVPQSFNYVPPAYSVTPQLPLVAPAAPAADVFSSKWGPGPGLSVFLALLGAAFLVGSLGFFLTTPISNEMFPAPFFYIFLVGFCFVISGLVLAVLALQGRRGTWLTALTIIASLGVPAFFGIAVDLADHYQFFWDFNF